MVAPRRIQFVPSSCAICGLVLFSQTLCNILCRKALIQLVKATLHKTWSAWVERRQSDNKVESPILKNIEECFTAEDLGLAV